MGFLDFVVSIMASILMFFYNVTDMIGYPNFGLAIILLTVAIRIILYPMTVKQIRSMKAMQELQPKIKEIQAKYKGNNEKLGKEMTRLYKESGVNPIAGCLPLLIQLPFLLLVFYVLKDFDYGILVHNFLWIQNLGNPDTMYIMPALAAITTFIQQKQTTMEMNSQAKMMLYIMPFAIGYISLEFSSGLVLYWVTGNVIQIIQQWFINRGEIPVSKEAK